MDVEGRLCRGAQLWYHVVGTPQARDRFVYAVPEEPEWMIGAEVTDDGGYLLISLSAGCEPVNRLFFLELESLPRSAATGVTHSLTVAPRLHSNVVSGGLGLVLC